MNDTFNQREFFKAEMAKLNDYKAQKGYIVYGDKISLCVNKLIYKGNALYSNDKIVVVKACQVEAIIGVKAFKQGDFYAVIKKLCQIKADIKRFTQKDIFAGIWAFKNTSENTSNDENFVKCLKEKFEKKLQRLFEKNKSWIDCACFDEKWFMRKEYEDEPNGEYKDKTYYRFYPLTIYNCPNVSSYHYFIGNLRGHLNLKRDGYFSYPEGKQQAGELDWQIILERNSR